MYIFHRARGRSGRVLLLGLVLIGLQACSVYKVPVVQGNVVTREQLAVLRPGMSRIQVRDILGTPLLTSLFRAERWDYVFTLKRQGIEPQARRVTVYFKNDVLDHFDADALPSETEFVATLADTGKPKLPVLEATPEQLQELAPPKPKQPPETLPPLPASYPPLEPGAQTGSR